jgi:DNA-binding winged helix-turn-helix (wHTH) protein/Tol biopolymer transport system component
MKATAVTYRFGPFKLDPARYELLRGGHRLRVSASLMELLLLLVSRPGELVTREQIVEALWKEPQSVDVRQGINTAIARLRAVLGDDPVRPRYVETVIAKGYRFIEPVEEIAPVELDRGAASFDLGGDGVPLADPPPGPLPLRDTPVHADPDYYRSYPTYPRDQHPGHPSQPDAPDVSSESPISAPATPRHLSRTATGLVAGLAGLVILLASWLVFFHLWPQPQRSTLWSSRQITNNDIEVPVTAAALSADGQSLAYTTSSGLFLREMATGRIRQFKAPALRVTRLAWFPDGTRVLLTGYSAVSTQPDIWFASTNGGVPRLFRRNADSGVPSPDGQRIGFTVEDGREIHIAATISEVGGADNHADRILDKASAAGTFSALFWSADGKRISYQQRTFQGRGDNDQLDSNYQWSYSSREIATGRRTAYAENMPFDSAAESGDGSIFYLRSRGGQNTDSRGMWRQPADPRTGVLADTPARICCEGTAARLAGISVTANGKEIAAIREYWQPDVFVGQLHQPGPTLDHVQRLTTNTKSDYPHAWDPKSQAVYFESNRELGDIYHLFRQQLDQPDAETITLGGDAQILPAVMPDGKTLLYEQRDRSLDARQRSIFRANLDGSNPRLVWKEQPLDEWRCPLLAGTACVLREIDSNQQFLFYALDLDQGKGKLLARSARLPALLGDWALSPDGRIAAIPNHDKDSPSIRLVRLDGTGGERELPIHQAMHLRGLAWAPDNSGFYAGVDIGVAEWLEFISMRGESTALSKTAIDTWAVPSPDGKLLAFVGSSISRNVFTWK